MIKEKNNGAFTTLYYRYARKLFNTAYKRIQDETIAADIVQDVFINFYKNSQDIPPHTNIPAYLHISVRNRVLNEMRNQWVRDKHHKAFSYALPDQTTQGEDLQGDYHALENKIENSLADLPEKCRQAFILSRYEHLSYKDIAERMNISVNTVEKHIGKALQILRKELSEYELPLIIIFFAICAG